MFVVVSYDIVDDRRRNRLAKVLQDYGHRVQKSVFECELNETLFLKMRKRLESLINREEDSIRYYFLCNRCVHNIEVSGLGLVREDDELIIV